MSFIDERIVKMKFDNSEFEHKITPTINSINQLNKATDDLGNNSKGMDVLAKAFSNVENLATQAGFHIKDVWLKVTNVLEYQVARKIVSIGKDIANALTLQGVSDGFKEYELKMGSIQTIMAGTGESLETVNRYLDELNLYADKTIYSFADMTSNIGKFTNAGVKLKDAVAAIQGVANVAAVSGANTNEASRAMYNFAQALSSGYVKLIDWKSIENANMATVEFKDTLLQVASAIGTVKQGADGYYKVLTTNAKGEAMEGTINATKRFNDSLSYQWMTTEVLTKALKVYATNYDELGDAEKVAYEQELKNLGLNEKQIESFIELGKKAAAAATEIKTFTMLIDTLKEAIGSGWAMTWQLIIGDFNEAKQLWTDVGNVLGGFIDKISNARNEAFKAWKDAGGRTYLINALKSALSSLYEIIKPVTKAFSEFFMPFSKGTLDNFTAQVGVMSRKLSEFAKVVAPYVGRIARGVFATIDTGVEIIKQFIAAISPLAPVGKSIGKAMLEIAAGIGDVLVVFNRVAKETKIFQDLFTILLGVLAAPIKFIINHYDTIVTIISTVGKLALTLFNILKAGFNGVMTLLISLANGIRKSAPPIQTAGELIKGVFEGINKALDKVQDKIKNVSPIFEGIGSVLGGIANVIGNVLKQIGSSLSGTATAEQGIHTVLNIIYALVSGGIAVKLYQAAKGIGAIGEALDNVGDVLERFGWKLLGEAVLKFAEAIAILTGSLWLIATIDTDKLASSTTALASIIGTLGIVLTAIMYAAKRFDTTAVSKTFKLFGKEFSLDAIAFTKLSANLFAVSTALRSLGLAVAEMAIALKIVASTAEDGHLWDSWAVISLILLELSGVALGLSKWSGGKALKGIEGLKSMAFALIELAAALKIVASIGDMNNLWQSWLVISLLLIELMDIVLLVEKFGNAKNKVGNLLGLVAMSGAILLLVQALKQVADMFGDNSGHTHRVWDALKLVALLIAELGAVEVALATWGSHAAAALAGSVGMIAVAKAVQMLMGPLTTIDNMIAKRGNQMLSDMITLGLIMAALVTSMLLLSTPGSIFSVAGALGMIAAAEAMVILVGALEQLGDMLKKYPGTTFGALMTITAALAVFALVLPAMVTALPGALALITAAGALVVLAKALEQFNKFNPGEIINSLLRLAAAIAAVAGIGALLAPLSPALIAFSLALGLAGAAMVVFSAGCKALGAAFPSFSAGLEDLLYAIISIIPEICRALAEGVVIFATMIAESGETLGQAAVVAIKQVLKVIVESAKDFATAIVDLIAGMLEVIGESIPKIAMAGASIIVGLMKGVAEAVPYLVSEGKKCITLFMVGMADAIVNNNEALILAANYLMYSIVYTILQQLLNMPYLGGLIPQGIKDGILGKQKEAIDAVKGMLDDIEKEVKYGGDKISGEVDYTLSFIEGNVAYYSTGKNGGGGRGITRIIDDATGEIVDTVKDGCEEVTDTVAESGSETNDQMSGALQSLKSKLDDYLPGIKDMFGDNLNIDLEAAGFSEDIQKMINALSGLGTACENTSIKGKKVADSLKQYKVAVKDADGDIIDYTYKLEKELTNEERRMLGLKVATDEVTEATTDFKEATSEATETVRKSVDVYEYGSGVIEAFVDTYGHLYNGMSDDDAWRVAELAVENFAIATYRASGKALETAKNTKQAKDYIAEMVTEFAELKQKVVNTIGSVFSGDSFFQKFEVSTEKTMEEMLHAMHTNIEGVANWSSQLVELGERGIDQGLLQQLAELGPKGFEYVNAFSNATQEQIQQANELFAEAGRLKEVESNKIVASYANAGLMATLGFRDGMLGQMVEAEDAAKSLALTTLQELKEALGIASPSKETREIGVYAVEGLRNGLDDKTARAQVLGVIKMLCQNVVNQIEEMIGFDTFFSYGANIGDGLAKGIASKESTVKQAVLKLNQAASMVTTKFNKIASPSKLYHKYGEYIAEGLADGMEDSTDLVEEAATDLANAVSSTFSGTNFFSDFNKKTEKTAENLISAMQSNIDAVEEWSNDLITLADRGIDKGLLKQLANLGPSGYEYVHAFVNSTDEELKRANELFAKAGEYMVDEVKDTAEEIEEVVEDTRAKSVNVYSYAGGAIRQFYYNYSQMYSDLKNVDAFEVAQFAIQNLAEKTYYASYQAKQTSGNYEEVVISLEDMITAFSEMKEKAEETVSSIFSGEGFFKEFKLETEKTAEDVLAAMQSNVNAVTEWSNKIALLGSKGINEGLLKQLAELGPKGYEYVNAFAEMTEEQMQKANELFEHAGLLPDTVSNSIISSYANAGLMASDAFKEGVLDNLLGDSKTSAEEYGYKFGDQFLETLENVFAQGTPGYYNISGYIAQGLADGLEDNTQVVTDAAAEISEAAIEATKEANEIASPSKVYRELGNYISEGFALGLEDGINSVEAQATALSEAVRKAVDIVNVMAMEMEDIQPVITPILDTSALESKARSIGILFPSQSLAMASSIGIGSTDSYIGGVRAAGGVTVVNTNNEKIESAINEVSDRIVRAIQDNNAPVNVDVSLEGDSAGIFRVVRQESNKFSKINGYNALV